VADTGKPRALAAQLAIARSADHFRVFADMVGDLWTERFELQPQKGPPALNYALRRPRGVLAVVSPSCHPLLLTTLDGVNQDGRSSAICRHRRRAAFQRPARS